MPKLRDSDWNVIPVFLTTFPVAGLCTWLIHNGRVVKAMAAWLLGSFACMVLLAAWFEIKDNWSRQKQDA